MQFFNSKIFTLNIPCIDNQGLCRELVHWEKLWYNYFFYIKIQVQENQTKFKTNYMYTDELLLYVIKYISCQLNTNTKN